MKRENRDGTPPARELGAVAELSADELSAALAGDDTVLIDTRRDRASYLASHWRGAIWAPWGGADFLAMAGSYIEPHETIVLLGDPMLGAAMARALYRIGLDNVAGIVSVDTFEQALGDSAASITTIDWDGMRQRLEAGGAEVLDVRRASEFAAGNVGDAINIAHTRLHDRMSELDRGRTLLVHCRSGHRATAAVSFLERQGFDVVHIGSKFADWKPEVATATSG